VSWATVRRYVGEKANLSEFLAQPHPGGFPLLPHLLLQARRSFAARADRGSFSSS